MHAFFAMIWNERDAEAALTAARLQVRVSAALDRFADRIEASGFALYELAQYGGGHSMTRIDLHGDLIGAIFGTVFDRSAGDKVRQVQGIDGHVAAAFRRSDGASIVTDFWGTYVAFARCEQSFVVIADPTSAIPCFYTQQTGVTLVFSHLEKCPFLDKSGFTINDSFITRILAYDKIQNGETGLNEVRELPGGHRLCITDRSMATDMIWDPREFAAKMHAPSQDDAVAELKETTQAVVETWAACFSSVIVNLSGGLDSSIVMACLAAAKHCNEVEAVHFVFDSLDPPEDDYAQAMAEHAGSKLFKIRRSPNQSIPDVHEHPATVRPYRQFLAIDFASIVGSTANKSGTAMFTGQGGDHLFLPSRSALRFADYLKTNGIDRHGPLELLRSAKLSEKSVWRVLHDCLPYALGKHVESSAIKTIETRKTSINRQAFSQLNLTDSMPIWATEPDNLPPVKFNQVASLMHMFQIRETMDQFGRMEMIHPLISQPLIELCLRLPTWLLTTNGRHRGLARTAFKGDLPDRIRLRQSKGDASRFFVEHLKFNRDQIVESLSNGELVRRNLISITDIESFIQRDEYQTHSFGRMMLLYYTIEAWLQTWKALAGGSASKTA